MTRLAPFLIAAALLLPGGARACELALAFALDVSASVDSAEYAQQVEGLAGALMTAEVEQAILAQPGGVALAAYEWSGRQQQRLIVDWMLVSDPEALRSFAGRLSAHARVHREFPTAIGYALGYGAVLMRRAPRCYRRVIDVSGDGVGNEGFPPSMAYAEFDFSDITVNGLAIGGADPAVIDYYRREVPHGPRSFVEVARDFSAYPAAMKRKLLREVQGGKFVSLE